MALSSILRMLIEGTQALNACTNPLMTWTLIKNFENGMNFLISACSHCKACLNPFFLIYKA